MKSNSITVKDVVVYHNKVVNYVNGSYIFFTDGSFCDVESLTVINKGMSCLSIGTPPELTTDQKPQTFPATSLLVDGVYADVDIQPIEGAEMAVNISGPSQGVQVRCKEGVLTISQGGVHQGCVVGGGAFASGDNALAVGSGAVFVGGRNTGRIDTGGGAYIAGNVSAGRDFVGGNNIYPRDRRSASVTKPTITIGVPKGIPITVQDVDGNVTIGDVGGSLTARTSTKGSTIFASTISSAILEVWVYGIIIIQKLDGSVRLDMVGEVTLSTEGESRLNIWRLRQKTNGSTVWGVTEGTTIKLTGK